MDHTVVQRAKVLLIEDDLADALLVERALERYPGFHLCHVTRLYTALETASQDVFDVAVIDLSLPDSYGLEGLTTLRSHFPDLPVVVLTGNDDDNLPLEALERGAQDYLSKNQCSPDTLHRALRYSIQRHQIQCENRRLLSELARQARYDSLTAILNRPSLIAELEREWHRASRTGQPLCCVMLDIDFFKRVNDTHGHTAGDTVLRSVANILKNHCRVSDLPGRYGGEEFLIVLPETPEEGAVAWAERLRQTIAAAHFPAEGVSLQVTASFGVAMWDPHCERIETVVEQADQALRLAKQMGRDQTLTFRQTLMQLSSLEGQSPDAFGQLTAADIMTPVVATLPDTATVQEATDFLLCLRVESAPIVNEQGKYVGLIGEEKLSDVLVSADAWNRPVTEIMRRKPCSFSVKASVATVQEYLSRSADRRVVILDGDRPVGLVGRSNILRWRDLHAIAARSRLQELSYGHGRMEPGEGVSALALEIQKQAAELDDRLQYSRDDRSDLVVAAATRIQILLERAIVCSQHKSSRQQDRATIVEMAG